MRSTKKYWQINENIRANKLRVISQDGKQLGIISTADAIKMARDKDLTLVEIAPKAKPPVAKIVDFGKFRYQEEKKQRAQEKKAKASELKEIRFSPFIAEQDYNTRLERIKEFLGDKNKVRLSVVFKRQQMRSKQFGYDLLKRILNELGNTVAVDMEPKFLGRHLVMVISPTKVKPKQEIKDNKNA